MLKIAILLLLQIQYATTATTKTATHNRLVVFFFLGAGKGEAEKKTVPRHDKVNHQQVPSRMCDVHGSERGITPLRKLTHETTRKKEGLRGILVWRRGGGFFFWSWRSRFLWPSGCGE